MVASCDRTDVACENACMVLLPPRYLIVCAGRECAAAIDYYACTLYIAHACIWELTFSSLWDKPLSEKRYVQLW